MDQGQALTSKLEPAAGTDHDLLPAIRDDVRQTLETVRAILRLLLPKEDAREGARLEDLLAALIVQGRQTLMTVREIQADLRAIVERGDDRPEPNGQAGANGGGRP